MSHDDVSYVLILVSNCLSGRHTIAHITACAPTAPHHLPNCLQVVTDRQLGPRPANWQRNELNAPPFRLRSSVARCKMQNKNSELILAFACAWSHVATVCS